MQRWLAFGTGIGIEIGPEDLNVAAVRVRPAGVSILGALTIHKFREQPAAEWGDIYGKFLGKAGVPHLAATVSLPREEVMVRQIAVPGVADRDLAAAIAFQIDSLHPYAEEDAVYDWARVGKTAVVLVGITRRALVNRYSSLFAEAGIKVAGFTFSAASVYSAVRLQPSPPANGFLLLHEEAGGVELYGESEGRPLFSARLNVNPERARELALSELRLPAETQALSFAEALPQPVAQPQDHDASNSARPYATALAAAVPRFALAMNLLPPEQRRAHSRLLFVPTMVLAGLLLLMVGALAAHSTIENRRYTAALQTEILKLQPAADRAAKLDRTIANLRNRAQTIDNFRLRTKEDMDALNELTKILASPTWLNSLELTRKTVNIAGETEQAAALLKLLDSSPQFKSSSFTMPMARVANGESFRIQANREGVQP